jgi:proliferating cell nuclear antigen
MDAFQASVPEPDFENVADQTPGRNAPLSAEDEPYIMRMCTSQATQFKIMFDVLKDLLTETNIRFDAKGFKIVSLDPGKIGMIYLTVYGFDKYVCDGTVYAGVYVGYLYKIIRTATTGHYLEWRIRRDAPKTLEIVLSHHDRRIETTHKLKILSLDVEEITIPMVSFDCVLTMPSTDFQRHIKELGHVSNVITIRGDKNKIQLVSCGDLGETCIDISPTPSGLNWIHRREEESTFNGSFFLKYLERFSRGQVDPKVELFFKQDYPLIMRYTMTIGSLRFCIAPISSPS